MEGAFTIFPMTQEMKLEAGKTYRGVINVANPAAARETFYYAVEVSPYSVMGENYEADLATTSTRTQIADWITIDQPTGAVAPNEAKEISFTITVPVDAPAGGQYAGIGVMADPMKANSNNTSVQSLFELISLVYAEVAGETEHGGEVLQNSIPNFVNGGAVNLSAFVTNTGNVHETATTEITVKNFFTGEVIFPQENAENKFSDVIMPATSRYLTREVNDLPELGVFQISQNITYLGETYANEMTLVACPIWFMMLVVLTIGVLIGTVVALIFRHRRTKSHIKVEKSLAFSEEE